MNILTRAEIDLFVNHLGRDPEELLAKIARIKQSGEPITINEARRSIRFWEDQLPDLPGGDVLLNGDELPAADEAYAASLKTAALFAKSVLEKNDPKALLDPKFAAIAQLLG